MKILLLFRLVCAGFLLLVIALAGAGTWRPIDRTASAGQGKGGEVIAKPSPTPKKAATGTRTGSRSSGSKASMDELAFWETIKNSTARKISKNT